jgi:hypothetical protein
MSDLIPPVGTGTTLETVLLADDRAVRVGAIQALNYSRAVVITHDRWKAQGQIARQGAAPFLDGATGPW